MPAVTDNGGVGVYRAVRHNKFGNLASKVAIQSYSNDVPSIRTPIFCFTSMPKSFILPACSSKSLSNNSRTTETRTNLDSFMLDLPQLHELLLAQIAIVVDRFLPVRAVDGLNVRVRIVRVVWRWDKFSGPQCRHPSFVRFYMVVFFMWKCC